MTGVVLLNTDYQILGIVSIRKAMKLLAKKKAEVVRSTEKFIHTVTTAYLYPLVIKLVKLVRMLWGKRVPYSKRNLLTLYGGKCAYCGKKDTHMTLDHIIPKSRGGKSEYSNVVPCCLRCNNVKDNRLPSEAGMVLRYKVIIPTISEFLLLQVKHLGVDATLRELGVI